jgi:hypothetical protein
MQNMANTDKFLSHNPTLLMTIGRFKLYEHPLRGDTAPIYMIFRGQLFNTGFYDLGDFDLALCEEIVESSNRIILVKEQTK